MFTWFQTRLTEYLENWRVFKWVYQKVSHMRDYVIPADPNDSDYCRKACLKKCQCQAYAETYIKQERGVTDALECLIWTEDLTDLQEEYAFDAYNLSVRVAISDISMSLSIFILFFL